MLFRSIPEGSALVCANHSKWLDPFLVVVAFGKQHHIHVMAKVELFRVPVLGFLLRKVESFPVDRGHNDVAAIRTSIKHLKNGEKLLIFPEGTRVSTDDAAIAKSGAVRLAARTGAPLVPMHIPRKKPIFRRLRLVIGEPYWIDRNLLAEGDTAAATEMMEKIRELQYQK